MLRSISQGRLCLGISENVQSSYKFDRCESGHDSFGIFLSGGHKVTAYSRGCKVTLPGHSLLAPGMPRHCCYLLALLLVVFQGGEVCQIAFQGLNTLLLLPVLLRFLLTFLFQIIDMFITTFDLGQKCQVSASINSFRRLNINFFPKVTTLLRL